METHEIDRILGTHPDTRKSFVGTFAIDRLPAKRPKLPYSMVINYDESTKPGSHWVALYADRKSTHFHDSLGLTPLKIEIPMFLDPVNYTASVKPLQHHRSTTCGHHAIAFIVNRARGMSASEFLGRFGADKRENDRLVRQFVKRLENRL